MVNSSSGVAVPDSLAVKALNLCDNFNICKPLFVLFIPRFIPLSTLICRSQRIPKLRHLQTINSSTYSAMDHTLEVAVFLIGVVPRVV